MKKYPALYLVLLFFLSGTCNLVYEIVWVRMFNLVFGVTVFAVSTVLGSFMLGLAVGGVAFGTISEKSRNPVRLFSILHAGIFLSTVAIILAYPAFTGLYLFIYKISHFSFYAFGVILFLLSLSLLIVPTILMGGTFPVAVKLSARRTERFGKDVGVLYSVNTLGGMVGCVVTVFFLLDPLGMRGTIRAAAFVDLAIAAAALLIPKYSVERSKQP